MSSNVVTGRRVAWWRNVLAQPGFAIFAFASPPALLWALYELVLHHQGMGGLGYMFWGGLAIIAGIGCLLLVHTKRTPFSASRDGP